MGTGLSFGLVAFQTKARLNAAYERDGAGQSFHDFARAHTGGC